MYLVPKASQSLTWLQYDSQNRMWGIWADTLWQGKCGGGGEEVGKDPGVFQHMFDIYIYIYKYVYIYIYAGCVLQRHAIAVLLKCRFDVQLLRIRSAPHRIPCRERQLLAVISTAIQIRKKQNPSSDMRSAREFGKVAGILLDLETRGPKAITPKPKSKKPGSPELRCTLPPNPEPFSASRQRCG